MKARWDKTLLLERNWTLYVSNGRKYELILNDLKKTTLLQYIPYFEWDVIGDKRATDLDNYDNNLTSQVQWSN